MATQTTHYNLIKPSSADRVAVGDLNDNSDTIDGYLYKANERADQMADDYNTSSTYNTGDYCRRENCIYKCNTDNTTGTWDDTKWDRVKVMDAVETVSESVDNVYGFMGVKNLNTYPYIETSHIDNDVAWTDNGDGTVTANGKATGGNSDFNCHYHTGTENNVLVLPKGNYIFSGCPSGGSTNTYYIQVGCTRAGGFTVLGRDLGNGVEISLTESTRINITCRIYRNYTASNLTFYPMIRFATDKDSTWQPYAQNNKELTENKVDWVSNGVLGAKNLNNYPYYHSSGRVNNNVTWTVDSDGILTANGKATGGNSNFCVHNRVRSSTDLILPNGKYILSGCPSGGGDSTYEMRIERSINGNVETLAKDYGNGAEFTLNGDDYSSDEVVAQIFCTIKRDCTASNLIFKPMVRRIEDTDDTYQPYAMTNKELTDVVNNVPGTAGTYTLQAVRNADNTITYSWV